MIDILFMILLSNQICDGNVVVDEYQHGNSHHVKFVITLLNYIAAVTALVSAITAVIHCWGVFDQQQEEGVCLIDKQVLDSW
jgi:hypothetical protein